MKDEKIASELVQRLDRTELLQFQSSAISAAKKAAKASKVRGLEGSWQARVAGMARRGLCENALEKTAKAMDAIPIVGTVPGTEIRVYQQVHIVNGALLGLASVPQPGELPLKNLTRASLASCFNSHWERDLFEKKKPEKIDLYALLLICRDPANLSRLQEIAIAVVAGNYDKYLHYEKLEQFLKRYEPSEEETPTVVPTLRPTARVYTPNENTGLAEVNEKNSKKR